MKKAYVLINCELGKEEETLSELRALDSIKEAHGTFGAYDIMVEISSDDAESLRKEITWKIRKIPSIYSTLTLTSVEDTIKAKL
jgi:DNA-binding Lrp family transcriptional regulator